MLSETVLIFIVLIVFDNLSKNDCSSKTPTWNLCIECHENAFAISCCIYIILTYITHICINNMECGIMN